MKRIDEIYMLRPYFGSRRIRNRLRKLKDESGKRRYRNINRKKVQRLMRQMGLEAIYPKPNLSRPKEGAKKYPYLLRNLEIKRSNQVWCTDITYIRLSKGFAYLTVIMDWHSRYIISWKLSNTLESYFCTDALGEALMKGGKPEIFNSDQGTQFTSESFTDILKENEIKISMYGRGRAMDNIFVERLWRTIKYEEVYLHEYRSMQEAYEGLKKYIEFYNNEREHQSLEDRTPKEVYFDLKPEITAQAA